MTYRKKLIEVSLPLEAINVASAREKSIRHGHPSTLHLWWARRPLAACRAVLFSSIVDDPSEYMPNDPSTAAQDAIRVERERLFNIIEDLVLWENSNNEEVLDRARMEIARSVARNLNVDVPIGKEAVREFLATKAPPVLDPFAGGGSIPLEAQRLGLRAYASDLNPVAVLINKALIEIPPKFANMAPVHPVDSEQTLTSSGKIAKKKKTVPQDELWQKEWKGAQGLAEDVRYYGKWMRDEALKLIGHHYPPVTITKEILAERPDLKEQGLKTGDQLTVIAWLWARTVKCPNPACGAQMPLTRNFYLSKGKGRDVISEIVIDNTSKPPKIDFKINQGGVSHQKETVGRQGAHCVACNSPVSLDYIRQEGKGGRMGIMPTALVVQGARGRIYLSAKNQNFEFMDLEPDWSPNFDLPYNPFSIRPPLYGIQTFAELFTKRQLVVLDLLTNLIQQVRDILVEKASKNFSIEFSHDYANSVVTYLAFILDKQADLGNMLNRWEPVAQCPRQLFARQAMPMIWDFAEGNPLGSSSGSWSVLLDNMARTLASPLFDFDRIDNGEVVQADAARPHEKFAFPIISTDPPYYDNIDYSDLADFFYVWLRRSIGSYYPDLFSTVLTPKTLELVATPYRFDGDKSKAKKFFEDGLISVFERFNSDSDSDYPVTIFYAFKQMEGDDDNDENSEKMFSTGWETMLESLIGCKFQITGTWPMRTEMNTRMAGQKLNALASSIVLVCRPRPANTSSSSRREFLSALKKELAPALHELQQGSIAPVDLAQASIGPGMAVFSRYSAVLEADGKPMSVRTALGLINQALDEFLAEQEGEYDGDTRWALTWFEQYGHNEAAYGVAETLSRAKNTSVDGLSEAGIVEARGGKVRLYRRDELDTDWDPTQDKRLTAWESVAHLIYALENGGEESAAELLAKLGPVAEVARDLAYRLYTVCERKSWAQDALGYNMLVVAWPRLKELSVKQKSGQEQLL